jgi:tetratricopeptide (TPR) repeat protein
MKTIFIQRAKILITRKIFFALGLFFLTVFAYLPVRNHSFINFDDGVYVTENQKINTGFSIDSVLWAFNPKQQDIKSTYWHPLTWISHMLDCQLFGIRSYWHHLSNLFYHTLNVLLLFYVFTLMTGETWKSAFVAALFALHPINVDSVAWIAERKNLLSTLFWLLTMLAYLYYTRKQSILRYLFIFFPFALGLLAKPMLVTLPCAMMLLDFWPLYRINLGQNKKKTNNRKLLKANDLSQIKITKLILEKLPLLIFSGIIIKISIISQHARGQAFGGVSNTMWLRIQNAIVSYVDYILKVIWPNKFAVFYPFPELIPIVKTLSAVIFLAFFSVLILLKSRKYPYLLTGWLWYLGTLAPVIGIIQGGLWPAMADRWAYIPLVGIFTIIAWGIPELFNRWKYRKLILAISATILGSVMIFMTRTQLSYWKTDYTLFNHTAKVTENNYIANTFLGIFLIQEGKTDEAISFLTTALKIQPANRKAIINLADLFYNKGDYQKALYYYFKGLWLSPDDGNMLFQIGNIFVLTKKPAKAIDFYKQAIQINPSDASYYNNLGRAFFELGDVDKAIEQYKKALIKLPCNVDAYLNIGQAMEVLGQTDEALTNYFSALKCNPGNATAQKKIGDVMFVKGDLDLAYNHYSMALKKNPDDAHVHYNLGIICFQTNQKEKAINHFQNALRIYPGYVKAIQALRMINDEIPD